MTINMFRAKVKKFKKGSFRMLEVGELAGPHDVLVNYDSYDWISEGSVGLPVRKGDVLLRLEFDPK